MPKFKNDSCAVILGASGGIGQALTQQLVNSGCFSRVFALSRNASVQPTRNHSIIEFISLDDYTEINIAQAANYVKTQTNELNLAFAATGLLHDNKLSPEKSLKQISELALQQLFTANSITPILFAKHFAGLMSTTHPAVLAAISARVGSITDNRLGGWYSYRASKAALNMLYKNLAVEMKRVNPNLIVSLLHPGTTDTKLSKPFQSNVPAEKLFSQQQSADYLYNVIVRLETIDSDE